MDKDPENNKKVQFRRKNTLEDKRTVVDKFVDKFWLINVTRMEQEAGR